jgi:hypothetical protein
MIVKEYILIAIAIAAGIYLAIVTYPQNGQVINCSVAEISPDYTTAMKEACRKERMAR